MQTDKINVQKEYLSLSRQIFLAIDHLSPAAMEKEILIVFEPVAELMVESDSHLLQSILRNLLANAIKYSYIGSQIEIDLYREGDYVKISVADHGIGIPRRNLQRIFRIDNEHRQPGTKQEPGSGLGLILVKGLADKIGAEVAVTSKLNKGSTFTVSLKSSATYKS